MSRLRIACLLLITASMPAVGSAQGRSATAPGTLNQEGQVAGAFRKEGDRIREDCGLSPKKILGCAMTMVTDHPIHLSQGSIAPQNGFGLGGSMGWAADNENFPWTLSGDAVRATAAGAWRAGAYFKVRKAPSSLPTPVPAGQGSNASAFLRTIPLYGAYVQTISLPSLSYYGLGNNSSKADKATFAMSQTIVGGNAIVPINITGQSRLRVAALGEVNGRFIHTSADQFDTAVPGFGVDRGFVQFGEGVRAKLMLGPRVRLNYVAQLQQFVAASEAHLTFTRRTLDLGHEFPLYRRSAAVSRADSYTPNDCEQDARQRCQPKVESLRRADDRTWNRTGSIGARMLWSQSQRSADNAVPFYFQQTLGGSDINGNRLLASFDDYRFRGPNLLVLQETFEHTIAGPVGAWLELNQGRVGLEGDALASHLRSSVAIGATLRAGAAPMLTVSWATGGAEGHHIAVVMSTALLGGGSRPSLH